jgi:hypothetical protein
METESDKLTPEQKETIQVLENASVIIATPEIYYLKGTPEQEKEAKLAYEQLHEKQTSTMERFESRRMPPGIDTYYGKLLFYKHDSEFSSLIERCNTCPNFDIPSITNGDIPLRDVASILLKGREEVISELKRFSPLDITALKAKAFLSRLRGNKAS